MQQPLMVSGKKLTLEQWLDNMELNEFKAKFKDMRLGELLSYTDKDINDLCEEFGIKMPYKKRLSDAIHILQANKKKIELINDDKTTTAAVTGQNTRRIISAEEEKAFDSIDERYKDVIQSIEDNQLSINKLKENHSSCKSQINDAFDTIISKLNNRRQQLIERLNFEGNKKMSIIKNNKEKLINYKSSIQSARNDADKLTMDVTIDRKTRKFRILQIEKFIHKYCITNQIQLSTKGHIDDNFLKFDCKSQTAQKALQFVSNYGNVLINEVPLPPVISIIGIGLTRCKIHFKMNPNSNSNVEKPKEWIVEYKKYIKEEKKEEKHGNDNDDDLDLDIASIGNDNLNQWRPKAKLQDVNEFILDSLQPNTKYSVRVCCSNDNGWSNYSQVIHVTTKAIEGGIDSNILDLKQKKKLLQIMADKFDGDMMDKVVDNTSKNKRNKSKNSLFLGGIFAIGKNKNLYINEENIKLQLLYRGTRDGFEADKFHEKCDFIANTIVVIECAENHNIFGGFSKCKWKSPRHFQFNTDKYAFLFSLRNNVCVKDKAQVFEIKFNDIKYAVCHDPKYGPIFGNGYSLCLYDRCNEVDKNYASPVSFEFRENPNQLSGQYNFTVKEYEVFQVHIKKK